jgi:dihydroneopterin aldolase
MKIAIQGAEFFAHHGFYPEEQKLGNCFLVDVEVDFEPTGQLGEDSLTNTVNYEQLHHIVAGQMKQTHKLLETVANNILDDIKSVWPNVQTITVTLKKLNPPLGHKVASSSVTINYNKA